MLIESSVLLPLRSAECSSLDREGGEGDRVGVLLFFVAGLVIKDDGGEENLLADVDEVVVDFLALLFGVERVFEPDVSRMVARGRLLVVDDRNDAEDITLELDEDGGGTEAERF